MPILLDDHRIISEFCKNFNQNFSRLVEFERSKRLFLDKVRFLLLNSEKNDRPNISLMSYQMPTYSCLFENLEKDMYNYQFIKTFYFGRNSNVKSFF